MCMQHDSEAPTVSGNTCLNCVYVDFDNRQDITFPLPTRKRIELVLCVSEKQKSIDMALVEHLLKADPRPVLCRVDSAKNAVDFVLACQIGERLARTEKIFHHIISGDKGFDALVYHLNARGKRIRRHDTFSAFLSFLGEVTLRSGQVFPAAVNNDGNASEIAERLSAFWELLKSRASNRPSTRQAFVNFVHNYFSKKMSLPDCQKHFDQWVADHWLQCGPDGDITYPADWPKSREG